MISLVGLPGSGKSTVGRHLARRLQVPFLDSDHEIEARLGRTIRDFFEHEGEQSFRDIEESVIDRLTREREGVLSTGGGVVLRPANRQHLRERTTVFYLNALPEDLARRMRHDTVRPLLQVADPLAKLRELHAQRDPFYRETAHYVLDTARPSVNTLVNMIAMQLELSGGARPGQ